MTSSVLPLAASSVLPLAADKLWLFEDSSHCLVAPVTALFGSYSFGIMWIYFGITSYLVSIVLAKCVFT